MAGPPELSEFSPNVLQRFRHMMRNDIMPNESSRMAPVLDTERGVGADLLLSGEDKSQEPFATGFFESGAAALQGTWAGLLYKGYKNDDGNKPVHVKAEPGWHVYQNAPEGIGGTKYINYPDRFVAARSKSDMFEIMRSIDEHEERRRVMAGNPLGAGTAHIGFWFGDPINWIAIGLARRAMTLGYVKPVRNIHGKPTPSSPHEFKFNAKTKTWEYGPPKGPILQTVDGSKMHVGLALASSEVPRELTRQALDPHATAQEAALVITGQFIIGAAIGRGLPKNAAAVRAIDDGFQTQERTYLNLESGQAPPPPRWGPLAPDIPPGGSFPPVPSSFVDDVVTRSAALPLNTTLTPGVLAKFNQASNQIHIDYKQIAADYKAGFPSLNVIGSQKGMENLNQEAFKAFMAANGGVTKYVEFITERQRWGDLAEYQISFATALAKIGADVKTIWPEGTKYLQNADDASFILSTAEQATLQREATVSVAQTMANILRTEGDDLYVWSSEAMKDESFRNITTAALIKKLVETPIQDLLRLKRNGPMLEQAWNDAQWSKGQYTGATKGLSHAAFLERFHSAEKASNEVKAYNQLIENELARRIKTGETTTAPFPTQHEDLVRLEAARREAEKEGLSQPAFPGPGQTRKGAGSQAADEPPLSGTTWDGGYAPKAAAGMENLVKMTPYGRVISSEFPSMANLAVRMFTPPYTLQMNVAHISSPINVQSRMLQWNLPLKDALMYTDTQYLAYRLVDSAPDPDSVYKTMGAIGKLSLSDKMKGGPPEGFISYLEFRERVFDVKGTGTPDSIPEVNATTDFWNKRVYEPMGQAAVEQGVLPAERLRENYANIIWDHSKIKANRDDFRILIRDWLQSKATAPAEIAAETEKVIAAILKSRPFAPISEFDTGMASALHERSIKIPMRFTDSNGNSIRDFIFRDIESAGKIFVRTLSADIELARTFGNIERVYDDAGVFLKEVKDGKDGIHMTTAMTTAYEDAIDKIVTAAGPNGGPPVRARLDKFNTETAASIARTRQLLKETDDPANVASVHEKATTALRDTLIKDLNAIHNVSSKSMKNLFNVMDDTFALRDLLRGTYGQPEDPTALFSRIMHGSKTITAMTMLFGPVWAAVPDILMPVLHEGLQRTLGTTFDILGSNIRKEVWNMSKRDSQVLGEIMEMYLAARAISITGVTDVAGRYSALERGLDSANSFMFVANLFNPWNDFFKTWAGMTIWSRFLDDVLSLHGNKGLSKRRIENLARGGITRNGVTESGKPVDHIKIIAEQFAKHGRTHKNIRIANLEAWDKTGSQAEEVMATMEAVRQAITSDIQRTIITPSKADLPLWASTELGSVVAALKTFSFAAINKILIPALQEKDRQALLGIFMLSAMGVVVENMKRRQRGDDRQMDLGETLIAGIERGGVLGVLMDFNRILETLTDNRIGLSPLVGAEAPYGTDLARKLTSVGGAVSAQYYNVGKFLGNAVTGNANMDDAERILPGHGIFYLQPLFNAINPDDRRKGFTGPFDQSQMDLPQTKHD